MHRLAAVFFGGRAILCCRLSCLQLAAIRSCAPSSLPCALASTLYARLLLQDYRGGEKPPRAKQMEDLAKRHAQVRGTGM